MFTYIKHLCLYWLTFFGTTLTAEARTGASLVAPSALLFSANQKTSNKQKNPQTRFCFSLVSANWSAFAWQHCCEGRWAECRLQDASSFWCTQLQHGPVPKCMQGGEPSVHLGNDVDSSCLMASEIQFPYVTSWFTMELQWKILSTKSRLLSSNSSCEFYSQFLGFSTSCCNTVAATVHESIACRSN